jgi:hypothetical protein
MSPPRGALSVVGACAAAPTRFLWMMINVTFREY